jgi:hypothetical protein
MNLYGKILVSIILGSIITLASSVVPSTGGGIGARNAGYPFPWMTQPIYPGAPIVIDYIGLVLDIIIWTVIALLIIQLFFYFEKRNKV